MIIRGGENISTAEVEHELEAHPDVRQAVVVGYPDPLMGERVAAFVVGAAARSTSPPRARGSRRGVARFKTPERVIVVDALPTLPTGKPDRDALRLHPPSGSAKKNRSVPRRDGNERVPLSPERIPRFEVPDRTRPDQPRVDRVDIGRGVAHATRVRRGRSRLAVTSSGRTSGSSRSDPT